MYAIRSYYEVKTNGNKKLNEIEIYFTTKKLTEPKDLLISILKTPGVALVTDSTGLLMIKMP